MWHLHQTFDSFIGDSRFEPNLHDVNLVMLAKYPLGTFEKVLRYYQHCLPCGGVKVY